MKLPLSIPGRRTPQCRRRVTPTEGQNGNYCECHFTSYILTDLQCKNMKLKYILQTGTVHFSWDLSVAVDSRRMPEAILKVTRKPQHGHFQSCI